MLFPTTDEPPRTSEFAKTSIDEERIAEMNRILLPAEAALEHEAPEPRQPVILVIGAPRSGTTLVGQLLAATRGFAYISNFVARFWRTPAVGATIEQALNLTRDEEIDFISSYGVTKGWGNSHEFGYFWTSWFGKGQTTHRLGPEALLQIDSAAFRRAIGALSAVRGLPLVFKNNTWCTLQAAYLAQVLPTAVFVVCRRDPLFIAQSLLKARRDRYGDDGHWWSIRPSNYAEILEYPPHHQVVFQALEVQREMDEVLRDISQDRLVAAPYNRLSECPQDIVSDVAERCRAQGAAVSIARPPPDRFGSTDVRHLPIDDWNRLERALEDYSSFLARLSAKSDANLAR